MSKSDSGRDVGGEPEPGSNVYRTLVNSIDGIVWEADASTFQFTYVSSQSMEMLGYEPSEWYADPKFWVDRIHPDDRTEAVAFCRKSTDKGEDHRFEYRMRRSDGSYLWLRDLVTVVTDEGDPVKLRGVMLDISAEKELEEERDRIHFLLGQRVVEQQCLYRISNLNQQELDEDQLLNRAVSIIPDGWQYPGITGARISFDGRQWVTSNFRETPWLLRAEAETREGTPVRIELVCLEERPDMDLGPFMREEKHLLESIASHLVLKLNEIGARRELERKVDELDRTVNFSPNLVGVVSGEGYFTRINSAFHRLLGFSEEEILSTPFIDLIHPDDRQRTIDQIEHTRKSGQVAAGFENRYRTREGGWKWISWHSSDWDEEKDEVLAYGTDITRLKEEEQRLRLFESVVTNTTEAVVVLEAEPDQLPGRQILYVNDGFIKMTGYGREEVIGKTLHFLNGEKTDPEERRKLKEGMKQFRPCRAEFINYKKGGEEFWVNISMVPVRNDVGAYTHWVVIGRDVSDRQLYQEQLLESLFEKEILLAEIHHRVKNNLAVVSGLMQLQADGEENREVAERLTDSVLRVKTMASIHEQLYQSQHFSRVDFCKNTRQLVDHIFETFSSKAKIDIHYDCSPVELNINQAIPCSLIVNEVVTNAFKYAFHGRKKGKLTVKVEVSEEPDGEGGQEQIRLTIADDGPGLPPETGRGKKREPRTLGMSLIEVLAQQLEAVYSYTSLKRGTEFSLRFSKTDRKGTGSSFLF